MRPPLPLLFLTAAACNGATPVAPHAPDPSAPSASEAGDTDTCALRLLDPPPTASPAPSPAAQPALAADLYDRALAPLVPALCRCTHHGDALRVEARVVPARGEVRASAPDDATVSACLSGELAPGRFVRDEAAAGRPLESVVTVPLTVDRRREQIRDARSPRAPTFEDD